MAFISSPILATASVLAAGSAASVGIAYGLPKSEASANYVKVETEESRRVEELIRGNQGLMENDMKWMDDRFGEACAGVKDSEEYIDKVHAVDNCLIEARGKNSNFTRKDVESWLIRRVNAIGMYADDVQKFLPWS